MNTTALEIASRYPSRLAGHLAPHHERRDPAVPMTPRAPRRRRRSLGLRLTNVPARA